MQFTELPYSHVSNTETNDDVTIKYQIQTDTGPHGVDTNRHAAGKSPSMKNWPHKVLSIIPLVSKLHTYSIELKRNVQCTTHKILTFQKNFLSMKCLRVPSRSSCTKLNTLISVLRWLNKSLARWLNRISNLSLAYKHTSL